MNGSCSCLSSQVITYNMAIITQIPALLSGRRCQTTKSTQASRQAFLSASHTIYCNSHRILLLSKVLCTCRQTKRGLARFELTHIHDFGFARPCCNKYLAVHISCYQIIDRRRIDNWVGHLLKLTHLYIVVLASVGLVIYDIELPHSECVVCCGD